MKFTVIKSIYDNEILENNRHEMSWERFCKILSKPTIVPKKDDVHLISAVEYYPENEAVDFTDNGKVRRCSDNVKQWFAIPVDIDGNVSIEDAKERFKDYEYILYTTFNHQTDKKPFDCFRMFFKIKENVLNADFMARKKALQGFIGEHDTTTLATSRGFYIPSCSEENRHHAIFLHNQGECVDVMSFEPTVEIPYVPDTDREPPSYEFRQKVFEKLLEIRELPYEDWWKLASALYTSGYTLSEFEQLSNTIRGHRKNKCKSQWNISKKKTIGFGYLVNLVKMYVGEHCLVIDKEEPKNKSLINAFQALKNRKLT